MMKKYIFFVVLLFGCASMSDVVIPVLANRKLVISEKIPGFEFEYWVCTKKFLGICRQKELHVDYYDLTDPVVKKQLIDMNFVLQIREKPTL